MKPNSFIDTNLFVRFLVKDVTKKSRKVKRLIDDLEQGKIEAEISDMVIAELVWVLESFYKLPPEEVAEKILYIVNLRGLKITNKKLILDSIADYISKKVDFIDSYNANYMKHQRISTIYSYDKDFDKLGVERIEP
jgi:predicted nucleic-acid-binding protein